MINICDFYIRNIFYGFENNDKLKRAMKRKEGGTIFAHQVSDPQRYGVVEFNERNEVISIQEKPLKPLSKFAVTGLYFYDNNVVEIAKQIKPSKRGELEITDLLNKYKIKNKLYADYIGRGGAWLDTGSIEDFYKTSNFVSAIENQQGLKIACLEEIALLNKWISKKNIHNLSTVTYQKSDDFGFIDKAINLINFDEVYRDVFSYVFLHKSSFGP